MAQHDHHEDPTRSETERQAEERDRANSDRRYLTRAEQENEARREAQTTPANGDADANPPRTTTDGLTAPKFGSAGSGGLEMEPGPERD